MKGIPVSKTLFQNQEVFLMDLNNWAIKEGASGLAYITFENDWL